MGTYFEQSVIWSFPMIYGKRLPAIWNHIKNPHKYAMERKPCKFIMHTHKKIYCSAVQQQQAGHSKSTTQKIAAFAVHWNWSMESI